MNDMTEAQCLSHLLRKISEFRTSCSDEQRKVLSEYCPKLKSGGINRIGVLKLVPKVV